MKTIESALAVIRNSGRILLYWDDEWDCWLLPNATIHEPHTADDALRSYDIPPTLMIDSHKPCPQHDDAIRHYVYTLGFYDIDPDGDYDCMYADYLIDIDDWQAINDRYETYHFAFDVADRYCSWWTLDEMLADPRMRAVNADLLGTLGLIETGLLPVPNVAG